MIIVSALYAVMWLPTYVTTLLYHFLFFTGTELVMIIYFLSLFCQFLYMCINPFVYATVFDPVKQILLRMVPWKRSAAEESSGNANTTITCLATLCSGRGQTRN